MLVIAVLLILIAAALIGVVVYDGAESVRVEAFDADATTTVAGVFFSGVATTLLLFLGLWILKSASVASGWHRSGRGWIA